MDDDALMTRALELAERGRTTVSPNPMVGCVLAREGRVVGEGWHERAGGPHAEVVALTDAGAAARGATAYVTLEPCTHTGRTPPCAAALVAAGVARVDVALRDPHPLAMGGVEMLRDAGVVVTVGRHEDAARRLNRVFLHGLATGRPLVVVKAATSLDGRIAAADGSSQWLTGPTSRARVHRLRAEVDAVAVGSGTVLADDPALTARVDGEATGPQPLRVVLDGRGRTPRGAQVLDDLASTLVVTTAAGAGHLASSGIPHAVVDRGRGGVGVAPGQVLALLWERGVRSLLVEGGASVVSSWLAAGLVDEVHLHLAPLLLGHRGRPLLTGGPDTLGGATRLRVDEVTRSGDDVIVVLTVPPGA